MSYENIVFDFINPKIEAKFPELIGKVYFANEVMDEPEKPFLLISQINDEVIHRTYENKGIVTEFKRAVLTFQVNYNSIDSAGGNDPDNKYKAKAVIDYLRALLSLDETVDYFKENEMSQRQDMISQNRDRSESATGGFIYVYEFDLPFDYVNKQTFDVEETRAVNVDIENKNDNTKISFQVP